MNIRDKILEMRYSRDKQAFVKYFIERPNELKKVVQCVLDLEEYPTKEYGSYILTHIYKSGLLDLQYLYPPFVDLLFKTKDQTVLRNIVNCISYMQITHYRESELIDLLIGFIQDPKNKVALHVYSIYVLIQFVEKYPELKSEIMEVIDLNSEKKTPAYTIARRNFIKKTDHL